MGEVSKVNPWTFVHICWGIFEPSFYCESGMGTGACTGKGVVRPWTSLLLIAGSYLSIKGFGS